MVSAQKMLCVLTFPEIDVPAGSQLIRNYSNHKALSKNCFCFAVNRDRFNNLISVEFKRTSNLMGDTAFAHSEQ